jgi:hypothetical protein
MKETFEERSVRAYPRSNHHTEMLLKKPGTGVAARRIGEVVGEERPHYARIGIRR